MSKYSVLFNPKSCNGKGEESAHRLDQMSLDRVLEYVDMTAIHDFNQFVGALEAEDALIICGGDGTLNYFINHTAEGSFNNEMYYFPCGTGNDFYHDVSKDNTDNLIKINKYVKDLPKVTVKGQTYRFLNNVGFGIDGYCCQVGDEMRAAHKENINYTAIAIKGLLGGFKPVTATVTVDGNTEKYNRVWLTPTMNGRFYGGGMMATPKQDRLREDRKVSVLLFYGKGKFKTLAAFPSIFQGEHVKHTDMVKILEGNSVKVSFSKPCALQIDGETILDVTEYEVTTGR